MVAPDGARAPAELTPPPRVEGAPLLNPALRPLLSAPIMPTLLRLAWPTLVVLLVQSSVGIIETYFVGFLGTEPLAGVALVFPVLMLMQMMSNGGIGGGVSSSIARALGAGRSADAEALIYHALVLAIGFGAVFSAAVIGGGSWLYRALGGDGQSLGAALLYSNVVFIGAIPIWINALMSSVLRGMGLVKIPATVSLIGALFLVVLSPALIFGWGPLPRLNVAGAGLSVLIFSSLSALVLLTYLRRRDVPVRLRRVRFEARHFKAILGVGALSALGTIQSNLTVVLVTAAVGRLGVEAIAGYGVASRLDYLLIPLLFGIGTAVVTMVAVNLGAGQVKRARAIAWTGAAIGAGATELIGLAAALAPEIWIGLFSDDPTVLATGAHYLRIVAPTYGLFGLGMMLYFAGQGAGRVIWPVAAGTVRLIVAGFGAWLAVNSFGAPLSVVFAVVATATALFGLVCAAAMWATAWQPRPAGR